MELDTELHVIMMICKREKSSGPMLVPHGAGRSRAAVWLYQ